MPISSGMERRPTPYDHLSREQLIELVVERDATIAALNARVTALEASNRELQAQVRRLLERLGNPPTPGNSSLPPSQGKKANRPDREPSSFSP